MTKTFLPFLLLIILLSCNDKPKGVNFLVTKDKKDTVSHFYYEGHEKYQFIDEFGLNTALTRQGSRESIGGRFLFGIKDRKKLINRFLIFEKRPEDVFQVDEVHIPFLATEYQISKPHEIVVFENYIDSLDSPVKKYETHLAIDRQSGDTILFQEVNYVIHKSEMITTLIVYDNLEIREEMRLVLNDAVKTIKTSINQAKQ